MAQPSRKVHLRRSTELASNQTIHRLSFPAKPLVPLRINRHLSSSASPALLRTIHARRGGSGTEQATSRGRRWRR